MGSFDLIGWSESTPGTGTPRIAAGLLDTLCRLNADGDGIILLPHHKYLLGVVAWAVSTGGYVRLSQTDLKLYHHFVKVALLADNDPTQGFTNLLDAPLPLIPSSNLWAEMNNATDEGNVIGALVGDGKINPMNYAEPDYKLRGTIDQTIVANTWTGGTVVWAQNLPKQRPDGKDGQGVYAIVGMKAGAYKAAGPGSALIRLMIPGATNKRPGVPAGVIEADKIEYQSITMEPWTKWPVMDGVICSYDQMPNVEILSQLADTDFVIEVDFKYLR